MHPTDYLAVAVWVCSSVSGPFKIYGAFFNGSTWATPTVLGLSDSQPSPKVKIDANGIGLAIWSKLNGPELTLQSARFDEMTWNSFTKLADLGSAIYNPLENIAMNDEGYAVVSWLSNSFELVGSTYNPNSHSWSSSYPISEVNISLSPTVTAPTLLDQNNKFTAILPRSTQIDTVVFDILNPPSNPKNTYLRLLSASLMSTSIAQNNVKDYTVFLAQTLSSHYLVSATRTALGPWNFLLAAHPSFAAASFSFALNLLNNRIGVAWALTNGTVEAGFYNFVNWDFTILLSSSGSSPSTAFYQTTSDRFLVIWDDHAAGAGNHAIYFSEFDVSSRIWSNPAALSQPSSFTGSTQLRALVNGQVIALWTREDATAGPTPRKILEAALGSP